MRPSARTVVIVLLLVAAPPVAVFVAGTETGQLVQRLLIACAGSVADCALCAVALGENYFGGIYTSLWVVVRGCRATRLAL